MGRKYLTRCVFTEREAAQDIDGYARSEIRGGSIGSLRSPTLPSAPESFTQFIRQWRTIAHTNPATLAKAGVHGESGSQPSPGKRGGNVELHQINKSVH